MKSRVHNISFKTEDNIKIAGILSLPSKENPPVIIFAHGFCANKSENGFFDIASQILTRKGYAVLRFDFRGCGESEGSFETIRLKDKTLDIKAALSFLKTGDFNIDRNKIGFVGFSLGATIGLLADIDEIKASAFWAPAFFPCFDMYPRYNTKEILREVNQYGYFNKANMKIGKGFLEDLGKCNTEKMLKKYNKPALVIHGTNDQRISPENSKKGYAFLTGNKRIEFIEGASHSFKESEATRKKVINWTLTWFDYYFDRIKKETFSASSFSKSFSPKKKSRTSKVLATSVR